MLKRVLPLAGLFAAWLWGTFFAVAYRSDDPLLDHDEVYWIGSTYYYHLAFTQHATGHPAWRMLPARENPPVSKYVLGLGLALTGQPVTTLENLGYFYLLWLRWEKNPAATARTADEAKRAQVVAEAPPGFRQRILERRQAPLPRPVVRAARDTVMVCAVGGSLVFLLMGLAVGERLAGLAASQLILLHPVAVAAASHAMSDTIALLFALAAAWAVCAWYRCFAAPVPPAAGPGTTVTLLAGSALALACGAKMNALTVVMLAGLMVAQVMAQRWRARDPAAALRAAGHGLLMLGVAVAVFCAINPAIWNDFPGALAATITEHQRTESIQVDLRYPHPVGLAGKVAAVVELGFYGWPLFGIMLLVLAWGVRHWADLTVRGAVCWWLVTFVGVAQWLPFAWSRYVLPLLAPSVWLVGLCGSHLLQTLLARAAPARFSGRRALSPSASAGTPPAPAGPPH
jgi:hypothetical protein